MHASFWRSISINLPAEKKIMLQLGPFFNGIKKSQSFECKECTYKGLEIINSSSKAGKWISKPFDMINGYSLEGEKIERESKKYTSFFVAVVFFSFNFSHGIWNRLFQFAIQSPATQNDLSRKMWIIAKNI